MSNQDVQTIALCCRYDNMYRTYVPLLVLVLLFVLAADLVGTVKWSDR